MTLAAVARFRTLDEELHRRFEVVVAQPEVGGGTITLEHPRDAEALISEVEFERDERLPYWADIWPSSLILAEVIAFEASAVREAAARVADPPGGRRLLELGCGLGLVSIAALHAGWHVLATDYYDDALAFARWNAWQSCGVELQTLNLDWRSPPRDLGRFDRVVASDVLYEQQYAELVAVLLARTIAPGGEGVIADPGRVAAADFVKECERRGLTVVPDAPREWRDGAVVQRITLYRVRHRTVG